MSRVQQKEDITFVKHAVLEKDFTLQKSSQIECLLYESDRKQDAWFKSHDICLVMITDREFKQMRNSVLDRLDNQAVK